MSQAATTAVPHGTLGAILIGTALSSSIYGVTCIQAASYFRRYWAKDVWILKTAVLSVWTIETVNLGFTMHLLFYYAVKNKGNLAALQSRSPWSISVQSATNTLSGTIVQTFFAWRVYIMSCKNLYLTGIICAMSCSQFALGLVLTVLALDNYTTDAAVRHVILPLSFAMTAATDIFVAGALCYLLHTRKSGHSLTDSLVNKLIMLTISNGVFSSSIALLAFVSLFVFPNTRIATASCLLLGKAYSNTLLSSLNSRHDARKKLSQDTPLSTFSFVTTNKDSPMTSQVEAVKPKKLKCKPSNMTEITIVTRDIRTRVD